ncbi:MAG: DUF4276 family protein [Candidatus Muirbacterium halophilum]|nr:DUF4276 family protein [Candidatus Muirbacterium halophilum]MCK9475088.1 DUF4276 family protein [Candidatus Muirbacterium halophilum]
MRTIVFLLEELSAKEMLINLFNKLNFSSEDFDIKFIVFEGKQDLDRNLESKIKNFLVPDTFFIILRDQDQSNCINLKDRLRKKVNNTGKSERVLIRIACHELETFYLGDLQAVENAYSIANLAKTKSYKAKFRNPDNLLNPARVLKSITKEQYQKVIGSRKISKYLNLENNKSKSFNALINGIKKIIST